MAQAHAFLGNRQVSHTFKFNPDSANWAYQENVSTQDTIGGRVIQLLSVQVSGVSVQGRAGSRKELQRLADNVREIMKFHIKTSEPVHFRVPSRNWNFLVYVQAMPTMGWDVSATSYPYQLQLAVEQDLTMIKTHQLQGKVLKRLADGIGYNPSVHGGGIGNFQALVDSVLKLAPSSRTERGGFNGSGDTTLVEGKIGDLAFPDNCTGCVRNDRLLRCLASLSAKFGNKIDHVCSCSCRATEFGTPSQHSFGNAIDIMSASGSPDMIKQGIANYLHDNWKELSVYHVIYNYRQSSNGGAWTNYPGSNHHTDHVHVSFSPQQSGACT